MPTLKDIAKIAGVNVSTVSKALNGSNDISAETREAILEITHRLNYTLKARSKPYGMIGVLCPEIKSNYYAQLVTLLETEFKNGDCVTLLGISDFKYNAEKYFIEEFRKRNVDGIVCITENKLIECDLLYFRSLYHIPFVLIAIEVEFQEFDYIKIDDSQGVVLAVNHLADLGHERIGLIGDTASPKTEAFTQALAARNLKADKSLMRIGEERFEQGGYLRMNELLSAGDPPTAVFATYDSIAVGAYRSIWEHSLRIPDDISIVGIDNISAAEYLPVPLTTVANHIEEMAGICSSVLIRKIEDRNFKVVQHTVIKPDLVIRASTGRPRK